MNRMLQLLVLAAFVLALLTGSSMALLRNFTKEELIQNSESIVLGTVQETRCAWAEDHSQIFTYVTFRVEDQFKGQPAGTEITLQIPGGTVGEITQVTTDTPTLEPGMRVIVHTFMQDTGYLWIYGWEKGVLTVQNGQIPEYLMSVEQFRNLVNSVKK